MARYVVICEVLWFMSNNFDELTASQPKQVLSNFYDDAAAVHDNFRRQLDREHTALDSLLEATVQELSTNTPCQSGHVWWRR